MQGSRFAIKGWRLTGIGKTGQIDASSARDAKESYKSSTNTAKPQSLRELVAAKSQRDTFATDERLGPIFPHGGGGPGKPLSNSSGGSSKDCSLMELASKEAVDQLHDEFASKLYQSHEKTIVDSVLRDVVQNNLGVTFDDIASLETAKRLLNEAIVLPLILPEFFTGIRTPWKGVLLFGPPGTGKTLLAKAVCSFRTNTTFFNCSSSSLISKYRGDSEKIIRCLFDAARMCSPSIIFLDEVDALVSSRNSLGEHEASRRLKTELFSQMDGLVASTNGLQVVFFHLS